MDSPCIKLCVVDTVTDRCIGCGRSRREIAGWSGLSGDERRAIFDELPSRLRSMTKRSVRSGRRRRSDLA